jgi:hypothetical protein
MMVLILYRSEGNVYSDSVVVNTKSNRWWMHYYNHENREVKRYPNYQSFNECYHKLGTVRL